MKSPQHHTKNSNPTGLRNILLLAVLFISGLFNSRAQSIQYPKVVKQTAANVLITEIKTTASKTKISFVYYNATEDRRQYFYLHAPGDLDVLYIKANGKIYKLLSTEDIANRDGVTYANPKETYSFSAYFEKLPPNVKSIDLIEGAGGSWNFYGISLTQSVDFKKSEKKDTPTKFRVDYQYMSLYDGEKEEWSEWIEKENTFVININDNGDIAHFLPSGKVVTYKKISGVEDETTKDGKHYQIIKALDENGDIFRFQLFDDDEIGLKMMYGNVMIQFAK